LYHISSKLLWRAGEAYPRCEEQVADVRGKGKYPLRSTMTPLDHLTDATFECSPEDVNVVAFAKVTSIIGGHDVVEEFLACGIWPLSKSYEFEVERKETPLSKVMVPIPKVTPTIGKQESEAIFKAWIATAANLLVGNYGFTEHNAHTGLRHG
jgi:hypothetical protein